MVDTASDFFIKRDPGMSKEAQEEMLEIDRTMKGMSEYMKSRVAEKVRAKRDEDDKLSKVVDELQRLEKKVSVIGQETSSIRSSMESLKSDVEAMRASKSA